jgi:hypothetical protein
VTITNRVSLKSVEAGITPIDDVPDAPTIGAATNVGTSRAFNNGSATVAYTAVATGGPVTTFTATSTPGSFTGTGASPITVTGLQSATSYTFTVRAANANGGQTSAATSSITATTVPQAPTIGTFTDGGTGTTGTLSFTAGATGGSTITNYSFSTDGSTYTALSPAQTTSPLSLTGLTVGTYNFSVRAINANGSSAASGNASGTVIQPTSFESIATFTANGTVTTYTFSSIPSTYKSLQLRYTAREIGVGTGTNPINITFNGETNVYYSSHYLRALGSSGVQSSGADTVGNIQLPNTVGQGSSLANTFGVGIIDIIDYASTTKNKTLRAFNGFNQNSATNGNVVTLNSGVYRLTTAVTSITLTFVGAVDTGSVLALYGIKG